jgi:hypothetical protein
MAIAANMDPLWPMMRMWDIEEKRRQFLIGLSSKINPIRGHFDSY